MDIERGIRVAVDTGDVTLGSEKSIQSLKLGKGRLAVVAANSPKEILEDVEYYANLSEIPFIVYEGTSVDLGSVCGKPFTVATLIINDPGDSTILDAMGQILVSVKFTANDIRFIALFESMTGAMVKDCIIDDKNKKVTFVSLAIPIRIFSENKGEYSDIISQYTDKFKVINELNKQN